MHEVIPSGLCPGRYCQAPYPRSYDLHSKAGSFVVALVWLQADMRTARVPFRVSQHLLPAGYDGHMWP